MKFNQIKYSIRVSLVIALFLFILIVGCMAAIAQDSNGVWVLTNKSSQLFPTSTAAYPGWKCTGPTVSGNSITSRWDFTGCSEGPGYVADTTTWTEPPSVLKPGTKMNITFTISAKENPSCATYHVHKGVAVHVGQPVDPLGLLGYAFIDFDMQNGAAQPVSKVITWDVPSGNIGDVIGYELSYQGNGGSAYIQYNYTYQASSVANNVFLQSRTEYIRDVSTKDPGVLILLSAWKHGINGDELVPNTNIYITAAEEGNPSNNLPGNVITGANGYVYFKWIFGKDDKYKDKSWIIYFSPDINDPYAPGSTVTTVSSYKTADLSAFTDESDITTKYPGVGVCTWNTCYTPFPSISQTPFAFKPNSIWKVKEHGPMGNWDGEWVIHGDGQTISASWSGGITDTIDIKSIQGDKITLYRLGNNGYYTGTISPDGLSMSGTASWYSPGEIWEASTKP